MYLRYLILLVFLSVALSCSKSSGRFSNILNPGDDLRHFEHVKAFASESPYATAMQQCVTTVGSYDSCTLEQMPLIGVAHEEVTVDAVMQHVMMSHDWMGERFAAALAEMPPVMLTLLKSVTAIVIDSEINPSFYTPATGAIYLNPGYLWISSSEKETIAETKDYRLEFGNELKFFETARYLQIVNAPAESASTDTEDRAFDDTKLLLAAVLFHELAHANDYFPNHKLSELDKKQTLIDLSYDNYLESASYKTSLNYPLDSEVLSELADVMFGGTASTEEHKQLTGNEAALLFEPGGANDLYNYYHQAEDVAMLFEEYMLLTEFNATRDLAFLKSIDLEKPVCDDYKIDWGQRHRVGSEVVKQRTQYVVSRIMGDEPDVDSVPAAILLPEGMGWCEYRAALEEQETTAKPGVKLPFHIKVWDAPRPR